MSDPVRMAVVQAKFSNGAVLDNLKLMSEIIRVSKQQTPDLQLILFPELAVTGYNPAREVRTLAEKQNGPASQFMASIAKEHGLHLAYGYVEAGEGGHVYNSVILLGPDGQILANYRKIHLTSLERGVFDPGHEFVSVDTQLGRIGLMICWDLAFPETARVLAVRGSDILLAPSAWEKPYDAPYRRFAMARAMDNAVFLATCNHIGVSGELEFFGYSAIYGPDGETLASLGEDAAPGVGHARLDPAERRGLQTTFFSMMQERRKDLYALKGEE